MNGYRSKADFRRALEQRLQNAAGERGVDLGRLRRRAVFERMLVRLDTAAPGDWVLKGGMALELRLSDRARATRDLDLATRAKVTTPGEAQELLATHLLDDPDGDGFGFRVRRAEAITPDQAGRPGWRAGIEARLAGREFATVRVDVVARSDELALTERLPLPGALAFAGVPTRDCEVVASDQHFAEKLHAYTRSYPGGENTRARDLADLVVLVEDELVSGPATVAAVRTVFDVRDGRPIPRTLPAPPESWREPFARLAAELALGARDLDAAARTVGTFWDDASERGGDR